MSIHYEGSGVTLHHGDCLDVLRSLPDASVDSVVTDPPYNLSFMGREWDSHATAAGFQSWCELWATECLRVLRPGGHLIAFGGTRTWHRLACAVEDAGFEVRDSIAWLYGSGFPKSLDVSKAIDKRRDWSLVERLAGEIKRARAEAGLSLAEMGEAMLAATDGTYGKWYHRGGHMFFETGRNLPSIPEWEHLRQALPIAPEFFEVYDEAEREVTGTHANLAPSDVWRINGGFGGESVDQSTRSRFDAPATPDAERWQGWGTALKPAFEPVVVARKPLIGTVAANVLTHGTGALNVDGCRIGDEVMVREAGPGGIPSGHVNGSGGSAVWAGSGKEQPWLPRTQNTGRWPANVVLDEDMAQVLDAQSGTSKSASGKQQYRRAETSGWRDQQGMWNPGREWEAEGYGDTGGASRFFKVAEADAPFMYVAKAPKRERPRVDDVAHPTVKPLALMRWLVRLVTPPGGTVLEPFAGSGTTVEACLLEGLRCVAIEKTDEYLPLILARIERQATGRVEDEVARPQTDQAEAILEQLHTEPALFEIEEGA